MRSRARINDSGAIVGTATYTPTGTSDPTPAGSHGVLLLPAKVSWVTSGSNTPIDDNNDPVSGNPMPGGGKRIFPDKQNPNDTGTGRNKVTLRVDTGGTGAGWTVYVKVFDVADPTPDPTQVIHPHGTATGDSVGGDNFTDPESTPLTGSFTSHDSTVDTAHATLDSTGKADFEFNVGYQPGNNYRVAVTFFSSGALSSLQVTDSTQPGYVPMDATKTPSGFSGAMSPPLTVWRRLWIEQDTMTAVTGNSLSGTVTSVGLGSGTTYRLITDQSLKDAGNDANRFENGTITTPAGSHPVISNTATGANDEVVVASASGSDIGAFTMTDDDDFGMPSQFILPLATNSLIDNSLISKFAPAYILVVPAPSNPHPTVPFQVNGAPSGSVIVSSYYDLPASTSTCWTHYLLAAYQPNAANDSDPHTEQDIWGETAATISEIYLETMRDREDATLRLTGGLATGQAQVQKDFRILVAHEIGQSPGLGSGGDPWLSEGGIMANSFGNETFSAASLLRFRSSNSFNSN